MEVTCSITTTRRAAIQPRQSVSTSTILGQRLFLPRHRAHASAMEATHQYISDRSSYPLGSPPPDCSQPPISAPAAMRHGCLDFKQSTRPRNSLPNGATPVALLGVSFASSARCKIETMSEPSTRQQTVLRLAFALAVLLVTDWSHANLNRPERTAPNVIEANVATNETVSV